MDVKSVEGLYKDANAKEPSILITCTNRFSSKDFYIMDKLQPYIFLMPVVALTLSVIFYSILLKKLANKTVFQQFVFIAFLFSFLLNLAWELIQAPLYNGFTFSVSHITFCGLAALADAIMVMLIYFSLAIIYKNPLWIQRFNFQRTFTLILIGGIGAILSEMRHLSIGTWSYTSSMPILPFVHAGLSPVLQFMVLPGLIFYLSFCYVKKLNE